MAECRQRTNSWRESAESGLVYSAVLMVGLVLVSSTGCYKQNLAPQIEYSPQEVKLIRDEIEKMESD